MRPMTPATPALQIAIRRLSDPVVSYDRPFLPDDHPVYRDLTVVLDELKRLQGEVASLAKRLDMANGGG